MPDQDRPVPDVDPVERLLRVAGPRAVPDPRRRELARSAVRDAWQAGLRTRSRRRWFVAGAPAMAAAALLVFTVVLGPGSPESKDPRLIARVATSTGAVRVSRGAALRIAAAGDVVHQGETVETPAGVVAALTLDGGGEIRQNGGTSVRWLDARRVALDRGHIYVDSGPHEVPLAVDCAGGTVRDIGTQFDVRAIGGELRVRVREGAIEVESPAGRHQVTAGRGFSITPRGVEHETIRTYGSQWDWILRGTRFRLEGATLGSFTAWVASEGGRRVEFVPPHLAADVGDVVLHGSIEGLTLDEALDVAFTTAGLTYRLDGGRVIVRRPAGGAGR